MTTVMKGFSFYQLNGRATRGIQSLVNQKSAHAVASSNYWSSSENNSNNSWNVNFSSSGNANNNNKNNSNRVRTVAALSDDDKVSVMEAYDDCCNNKMGSNDCIMFRLHPEDIINLAREVKTRQYEPDVSTTFVVTRPKLREIFAAHFRDRIVQHWIYMRLNPLFEERFRTMGDVSYNCRKGFGTLAARKELYRQMHRYGFAGHLYVGKFDIASYFMSIDIDILWEKLVPFVMEHYKGDDRDTLLYLSAVTIHHRPQDKCVRKGNLDLWTKLPPSKSLFGKDRHTGMAIGNLTTQMLCNFYLSFFDEKILRKIEELGYENPTEHYDRFVDDFVLHSVTVADLRVLMKTAEQTLKDDLHLRLHPDKVYIQPQRHGVKYVGGVIMPGRVYIINRTIGAMSSEVHKMDLLCRVIMEHGPNDRRLSMLAHAVASVNSYSGFLVHGNTYNIQKRMLLGLPWWWKVCYTRGNLSVVKLKRQYRLRDWLLQNEERRLRVMQAFLMRRHSELPDERYFRRTRAW